MELNEKITELLRLLEEEKAKLAKEAASTDLTKARDYWIRTAKVENARNALKELL